MFLRRNSGLVDQVYTEHVYSCTLHTYYVYPDKAMTTTSFRQI